MNPVAAGLRSQLEKTHAGDPWYGNSRATLLAGLPADQAAMRIIPGVHTIWELVLHMTSWTNEVRRRLGGAVAAAPVEGDWPATGPVTAPAWDAAKRTLDAAHAHLLAAVDSMAEADWGLMVGAMDGGPAGSRVTRAELVVGLAQHDAYHLGQIALLRRAGHLDLHS
jgi:uncharacterized damage-inducible protein DinB